MALRLCRECKKEVSTEAKTCPHCGVAEPGRSLPISGSAIGCLVSSAVLVYFVGTCYSSVPSSPRAGVSAPVAGPEARGSLTLERTALDGTSGWAKGIVRYNNTTGRTFTFSVAVSCDALNSSGRVVGTNQRSFFAADRGSIGPGFSGTLEVPVDLQGASYKSMRCEITSAR